MKTVRRAPFASLGAASCVAALAATPSFAQHRDEHAPQHAEHAAATEPKHEGGQGGDHDHPESVNWTDFSKPNQPPFIALVINTALLFGLYYWKGKKPIAEGLKNRRLAIAKEIEEAARLKAAAEERAKVYQAKLGKLDEELATAREALLQAGKAERDRAVTDATEKADRMRRDAEFMVEQEMKQLRVDIQRETVEAAIVDAEDLLKKRITPADHERLAEEYLADLSKLTAGGAA